MGRLRRLALWCGAAVLGITAIALLIVNLYVQSQGAQARIQQELSRRLGTPIRIRSISVTPWSGLTLTGITIPQASSGTTTDFLEAKSFHLHVRFLPLFSRRLIIKEVSLLSPSVVWVQNENGKWRLPGAQIPETQAVEPAETPSPQLSPTPEPTAPAVAATAAAPETVAPAQAAEPSIPASSPVFVPELRRMSVSNGNFRFLDHSGTTVATFEGVKFNSFVRNNQILRGGVNVAKISLRNRFFLQDLQSPLHYDPGLLDLSKISAHAGSGDIKGQFSLQSHVADSPFTVSVEFREIQAEQIVSEAGGPPGVIKGKLEGSFDATGKSSDSSAINGRGEIYLRDGQLQQYSLLVALGQILQIEELTQLQLQQADVKYHIDPGVVTVDELILRSPNVRVSATGTIGFNGKLRLQSQLAINDKIRAQLFSPIRDNFAPTNEPGYFALDFQVNGTIDRPKTNLMEKLVGRNLKDFVSGLLGGSKADRPKKKRTQESDSDVLPEPSAAPSRNPDARTTPP